MVFSIVSAANDWLNNEWDAELKRLDEERERKIFEAEEAERNKCHGTAVTVENFLSWKAAFDKEMAALKKSEREDAGKKLTGRELFLTDKSLIESDLKFLEESGGEAVRVDESLFQDLDDLELDDPELLVSDASDE